MDDSALLHGYSLCMSSDMLASVYPGCETQSE